MAENEWIQQYYIGADGALVPEIINYVNRSSYVAENMATLSGTLKSYKWERTTANGSFQDTYYVLELDSSVSVVSPYDDNNFFKNRTEVEIFGSSDYLASKINQQITVTGVIDTSRWTQYYHRNIFLLCE